MEEYKSQSGVPIPQGGAAPHPPASGGRGGYEPRDIGARPVIAFLVGLAVTLVVLSVLVLPLVNYFERQARARDPKPNPMVGERRGLRPEAAARTFPEPRLQPDEVRDMTALRGREEQLLNHYTWVDQRAGQVRIPVERAMDLLVQQGLPAVSGAPPALPPAAVTGGQITKPSRESAHAAKR